MILTEQEHVAFNELLEWMDNMDIHESETCKEAYQTISDAFDEAKIEKE